MKVALVCDWLTNVGGAEKVLLTVHKMYPDAPIYTSQYNPRKIDWFLDADVRVGWMRILPASWRRFLGWLRARYFAKLDLTEYDLVISVTGAEAKAVKTKKSAHICYCHVPTQYYWQMYDDYVKEPGFGILNPVVRCGFKLLVKPLRKRDFEAAQKVDQFVTISEYAAGLIKKYYKRDAVVVHPPVEVAEFRSRRENGVKMSVVKGATAKTPMARASGEKAPGAQGPKVQESKVQGSMVWVPETRPYYITTSRQVTWKRLDLVVKACVKLGQRLVVIGEGPEHEKLVKMAKETEHEGPVKTAEGVRDENGEPLVQFLPVMKREELAEYLAGARGYLFPSLEPFGIAPVEALASGCPVIAYGKGGACDYVKDGVNGALFDKQTVGSLCDAMMRFEKMELRRVDVVKSAEKFSVGRFEKELKAVINAEIK